MIKRALISVSNKAGIVTFAKELENRGIEILSTGGTARLLRDQGIAVKDVAEVTKFPECLDGRVKTLHPFIHGGILAIRDNENHLNTLKQFNIIPIDLVVINLYPFKETILKEGVALEEAIENIDIGGPAMLRAAAKNYRHVTVVASPKDYNQVIDEIKNNGNTTLETRYNLALKVFRYTSQYDALIASYLGKDKCELPHSLTLTYEKVQSLRYGENPHQSAAFYREIGNSLGTLIAGEQLQGKELSFNNINDGNSALELLKEFQEPTVVVIKHTNPCGVASGKDIKEAYEKAYEADPLSIFGGVIGVNRMIDEEVAKRMTEVFLEVIIAPDFTKKALEVFERKKNLRLIKIKDILSSVAYEWDIKKVLGGLLVQNKNEDLVKEFKKVTNLSPTDEQKEDLLFALKVVKHIKSNGIVLARDKQTLGIGPGQTSRIWALQNAINNSKHSMEGSVLASDAFFPFRDCVDEAAKAGIKAIIQPGGSLKDEDSIKACNEQGIAMIFTGTRHFKH